MSFFNDKNDVNDKNEKEVEEVQEEQEEQEKQEEQQEEVKIKVGDQEYSQDELDRLVSLGKIGVEAEEKYNTKLDKVWPEFSKTKNEYKQLKEELEQTKSQVQQKVEQGDQLPEEGVKQAQEAARKLGIVLEPDFEKRLGDSFRKYYVQERAAEKLLEEGKELEREITGKDGRPKFDLEKTLTFMSQNPGFKEIKKAYEAMHPEELAEWRADQILKGKKKGISTLEDTPSDKQPQEVRLNNDNLAKALEEALNN